MDCSSLAASRRGSFRKTVGQFGDGNVDFSLSLR